MLMKIAGQSTLDNNFDGYGFDEGSSEAASNLESLTDSLDSIASKIYALQEPLMRHGAKVFAEEAVRVLTEHGLYFAERDGRLTVIVDLCEFEGLTLEFDLLDNLKNVYSQRDAEHDERKRVAALLRTIADTIEE